MLEEIVVADFSRVLAGPLCSQLLGDAGARVIKIEEPERGDETRRWGPPFVGDLSAYFLSINRNKESVTLNLKSDEGRQIAGRLVDRADVVLDNFLPSQRKLLPQIPPRAVHCSIRGYDSDTVEANTPGYDLLAQAASGLMFITGEPEGDPMKVVVALADVLTAHYAFGAITSALVARERTGRGAAIEVSLFSAIVASLVNVAQGVMVTGREAKRYGNAHPSVVPYQLFHGSDRPFAIGAGTDRHFQLLCKEVLDRDDLARDRRYSTNAGRVKHRRTLLAQLERAFRKQRAATWVARCRKSAIPASLVQGVREALRSPAGRQLVDGDSIRNPVRVDGKRAPIRTPPPSLGAHTDVVLRELGYASRDIVRFRREGII